MPEIEDAIVTVSGNPWAVDEVSWKRATEVVLSIDMPTVVAQMLDDGPVEEAKRLVLAYGFLQAVANPDETGTVLSPDVLPRRAIGGLPRTRGEYLSVVTAAGRCYRALSAILGTSEAMRRVRRETWAACFGDSLLHTLTLAPLIHDHDVLIFGETGTGKEAIALAIQEGALGAADGKPAPRSALNVAAVPETLVASELFGHIKGAFTGASEARIGRIRSADNGCFFLDEVGDLNLTVQVKLLRVIETNLVNPLGSDEGFHADVRYVAATHKDLLAMVEAEEFRRDLYQRLAGNVIRVPPLRDRPEDIADIGEAFIEQHLPARALMETRDRAVRWLRSTVPTRYDWPGNVRELINVLRNLLLGLDPGISGGVPSLMPPAPSAGGVALPPSISGCSATLTDVQDWYLTQVLDHTENNFAQTARILGVDRTTVRRHARRLRDRR